MNKFIYHFICQSLSSMFSVLLLMGFTSLKAQPEVVIDQGLVSTATIHNPGLIRFFLEAYLIPEDSVTKIEFIDATGNGFGEDDLIKCFPSEKTYFLYPSDTAQQVMSQWKFTSNVQSVTRVSDATVFETLETDKASNWILAGLLQRLNLNYHDVPIKIYFERDSSAMVFEMWGFNRDSLRWQSPPLPPKTPETTYDLLHVVQSDTLILSDTTYYDQFFVFKNIADTVVISEEEFRRVTQREQLRYQPGITSRREKQK